MRQVRQAGSIAMTCALFVAPAVAGVGEGDWEVGFGLGATEFDSSVTDEAGTYFDVRGGYFLSDLFQLEGEVSATAAEDGVFDISLVSVFGNAVFNFRTDTEVTPYVLVGIGNSSLEIEAFGLSVDDDSASFHAAAGSRFFVGSRKKMAVRVELSVISEDTFDERSSHVSLSGGLTWRIGQAP